MKLQNIKDFVFLFFQNIIFLNLNSIINIKNRTQKQHKFNKVKSKFISFLYVYIYKLVGCSIFNSQLRNLVINGRSFWNFNPNSNILSIQWYLSYDLMAVVKK